MRVALPEDVDPRMLDPEARTELRSLAKDTADLVARHLVMAGRLIDEDAQEALRHARAARAMAGRVGAVREAAGLTAYHAGDFADALSELRTARRITGRPDHLPVLADCERALGRPERALAYGDDPEVTSLEQATRVELVIVLSGARRDMGQADAAVLTLQDPARRTSAARPWAARLWYAYADALLEAGREEEARDWFGRAAEVDVEGETDAVDRLLALDGIVLDNFDNFDDEDDGVTAEDSTTDQDTDRETDAQEAADSGAELPAADGPLADDAPAAPEPAEPVADEPEAAEVEVAEPVHADPVEPTFQAPPEPDEDPADKASAPRAAVVDPIPYSGEDELKLFE
ncbi:MAG: tetratricopeptide 4 [Frankiales bacterium]|nr:tetratricopeptide 4 [Frankiales bacterium]